MPISGGLGSGARPILTNGAPPVDDGPTFHEAMADARNRPTDFPATERAIYIKAMVSKILEYKAAGKDIDAIKELLPEFAQVYPHLVEMVSQDTYDAGTLQTMLHMLEKMGSGSLTQHQASVIVGQRLFEKARK